MYYLRTILTDSLDDNSHKEGIYKLFSGAARLFH
jgi:hypothetical protein